MKQFLVPFALAFGLVPLAQPAAITVADTNIANALTTFRTGIGGGVNNGNAVGTQLAGHREINWDAPIVPVLPAAMPGDFFNSAPTTRGLIMVTPGTGLMLSATNFSEVDASYAAEFSPFSPSKIISAQGSNVSDITFRVPGTTTPATVNGFGVVFSDVDVAAATTLKFFGVGGTNLGTYSGVANKGGHSFLGVYFDAGERVAGVRITAGNAALGAGVLDVTAGGTNDLVVMDDFLYSEPQAIPEPVTWHLLGGGLLALAVKRARGSGSQ